MSQSAVARALHIAFHRQKKMLALAAVIGAGWFQFRCLANL
jgi:hypothetical protein